MRELTHQRILPPMLALVIAAATLSTQASAIPPDSETKRPQNRAPEPAFADRLAAFDSFNVGRSKWRLLFAPDGWYEYAHNDPLAGRFAFTSHIDRLSPEDLAKVDRYLAETRYLNGATDDTGNAFAGYLSVKYKSQSFTVNLSRREEDDSYDKLMGFVDSIAANAEKKIPKIPWQPYTRKRFDDAVAKDRPVLQYYFEPAMAHEIHSRAGPASRDTVRLIEKHGVVCLNLSPEFGRSVFAGRKRAERPDALYDGLSIYLPKTKQTILINHLDAECLLGALRRALVAPRDGMMDLGGSDFRLIPPTTAKQIAGFEFTIHTESDWVLPDKPGEKSRLLIKLGVWNRTDRDAYFARAGAYFPILETPDGKKHVLTGKREGLPPDDILFEANTSAGVYFRTYLERDKETGEVSFCYGEAPGSTVRLGPIAPGEYRLSFKFVPPPMSEKRERKQADILWSGRGTTAAVPITVHSFSRVSRLRKQEY